MNTTPPDIKILISVSRKPNIEALPLLFEVCNYFDCMFHLGKVSLIDLVPKDEVQMAGITGILDILKIQYSVFNSYQIDRDMDTDRKPQLK